MMMFLSPEFPNQIALQLENQSLSFGGLNRLVTEYSTHLKQLPRAILVLTASPSIDFIVQLLASLAIEQPIALLANSLTQDEINHRLAILGRYMTIDSNGHLENLHNTNTITPHAELALILFTSGTTGQVKAVQLSKKNIMANSVAVIKALEFHRVDSQLLFLPLSYSFGLLGQLIPGLMTGLTTRLINQFADIKSLLEQDKAPQMWSGVPSHWVAINKMVKLYSGAARNIKAVVSAGAPLSLALRAELNELFSNAILYNNYGLTEASPRVLTYSSKDPLFMADYAGYPVGDWQVKLSAEKELFLQGQQMMLGYLGEHHETRIHDGWLATGDMAEITPDGLIAIKGRRDNIVNIGGEKINLNELEQKISQLEDIKEVIVVPVTDELYGYRLIVCLGKNALTRVLTEQEFNEKIRQHLLPKILPLAVRILASLPRNQHGKLDRKSILIQNDYLDYEDHK